MALDAEKGFQRIAVLAWAVLETLSFMSLRWFEIAWQYNCEIKELWFHFWRWKQMRMFSFCLFYMIETGIYGNHDLIKNSFYFNITKIILETR